MKITTIAQAQAEMDSIAALMMDKGVRVPRAEIHIASNESSIVWLRCEHDSSSLDGADYKTFRGETVGECVGNARDFIASLPDADETNTKEYLAKVADAIDFAADNNIADEYVTPLRGVTCAMTDNLLTSKVKS